MNAYIITMDAVAVLLLSTVAAGLAIAARRALRGPFRASSIGGAAVCLLLMIASLHHLLMVAAHSGLLASHWADWLLGPLAAIQATLAVLVAVAAVILVRNYWHRLGRAHTMVEVLTDRLPPNAHAKQARLTAREQEVLDLIRKGVSCSRPRGGPGCRAPRSSPQPRLMRSRRLTAHSSAPHPAQMIFAYLLCVSAGRSPVVRIVPFVDRAIRSTSPGSTIMKRAI
jgi:hypothetical protein